MAIPVEIPYKTYLIHLKRLPYNVTNILPAATICQNKDTAISYGWISRLDIHLGNQRDWNGLESEWTWLQLLSCACSLVLSKKFGDSASVRKILENEHIGLEHSIKSNRGTKLSESSEYCGNERLQIKRNLDTCFYGVKWALLITCTLKGTTGYL
jgi:hypothetical protein